MLTALFSYPPRISVNKHNLQWFMSWFMRTRLLRGLSLLLGTGWTIDVCTISLFLHLPFTLLLLFIFFSSLYKNSISDGCVGWEKCDALPTACSVFASEPQWGLKLLLAALLTSGNLDASLCVRLWLLQLQTNDAFDLLFVWKQREACGPTPLCPTHRTHSLKKLLFMRVCNMCVHALQLCWGLFTEIHWNYCCWECVWRGSNQHNPWQIKGGGGGVALAAFTFTVRTMY